MFIDLVSSFSELPPVASDGDIYSARVISPGSRVRIARDSQGNPSLLVTTSGGAGTDGMPVELRNLVFMPACTVEIAETGQEPKAVVDLACFDIYN
ncbi:MAG: hypothetical protein AAF497_10750 [Planctomycetota bacterium]